MIRTRAIGTGDDFVERLTRIGMSDVERIVEIAATTIAHLVAPDRSVTAPLQALEHHWYESLDAGAPDFSVYDAPEYLADLWACWVLYSRRYLVALSNPSSFPPRGVFPSLGRVGAVADLGCGLGYSTATLRDRFPYADVVGTNLLDTTQGKIAATVADDYDFRLLPAVDAPVDLVFASEYFEHFERPVEHLRDVLSVAKPGTLIVANTFTADSIGHFRSYDIDGRKMTGSETSRAFNGVLRGEGFASVETKLWNGRPKVWRR